MFVLCESMKWSHLPVAGGLYDQDPDLLDGFMTIFSIRAEYEAEERNKRDKNRTRKTRRGASRAR